MVRGIVCFGLGTLPARVGDHTESGVGQKRQTNRTDNGQGMGDSMLGRCVAHHTECTSQHQHRKDDQLNSDKENLGFARHARGGDIKQHGQDRESRCESIDPHHVGTAERELCCVGTERFATKAIVAAIVSR